MGFRETNAVSSVRASIGEAEAPDSEVSYEWRPTGISMELRSPNHRTVVVGLLELYGSKEKPQLQKSN